MVKKTWSEKFSTESVDRLLLETPDNNLARKLIFVHTIPLQRLNLYRFSKDKF